MPILSQQTQQLQQDIQNELVIANQLNQQILNELQQIKSFTDPGQELDRTIKQNSTLICTLANIQKIDIQNIPVIQRNHTDERQPANLVTTEHSMSEMDVNQ